MKNLPTLHNDSPFAVHFSISVLKTRAILLFKIKIKLIEMFELNERRGSTIGLAGCGIGLFFVVILGMGAKNRSGMREF